jgi:dTDP-glucose pyrophosphorylase
MSRSSPALVLLAAGLGRRYGGLKQLEPVGPGGAALLDYTLTDAAQAGFGRAVVVVRPEIEDEIRSHLERTGSAGLETAWVHQMSESGVSTASPAGEREKPWGTAQAVLAAGEEIHGPFAVANADDHYGPGAWSCLGEWLLGPGERGAEGAVVGYRLSETLSPTEG